MPSYLQIELETILLDRNLNELENVLVKHQGSQAGGRGRDQKSYMAPPYTTLNRKL